MATKQLAGMDTDSEEVPNQLNLAYLQLGKAQIRISQLESENTSLKSQLAAQAHQTELAKVSRKRKYNEAGDDVSDQTVSLQKYKQLEQSYNQLIHDHSKEVTRLKERYRVAKTTVGRWKEYIDKNQAKKNRRRNTNIPSNPAPDLQILGTEERTSAVSPTRRNSAVCMDLELPVDKISQSKPLVGAVDQPQQDSFQSNNQQHVSSQPTEIPSSPPKPLPPKQDFGSDNQPIFVSARTTERGRRRQKQNMVNEVKIKQEDGTASEPVQVPSEGNSDPSQTRGVPKEISDLDEPVDMELDEFQHQPFRRQRIQVSRKRSSSEGYERPARAHFREPKNFGPQGEMTEHAAQKVLRVKDMRPRTADGSGSVATSSRVLKPLSVNVPRSCPSSAGKDGEAPPHNLNNVRAKIMLLTEDGDDESAPRHEAKNSTKKTAIAADARHRLDQLLDGPQTVENPILSRDILASRRTRKDLNGLVTPTSSNPTMVTSSRRKQASKRPLTPQSEENQFKSDRANHNGRHPRSTDTRRETSTPVQKRMIADREYVALRSLPLDALKMNDFKINPKYQGTDFAWADSVRGKEQRRCLPGCTRPDCCGADLRNTWELGGKRLSNKSDVEALEAYLGPNWRDIMGSYDKEKRVNEVNEAHFAAFARDAAKHRTAFERPSEPPGFWTTEMPSTQEAKKHRELADQQEREKIEARWREAMRSNGRWMFRDES